MKTLQEYILEAIMNQQNFLKKVNNLFGIEDNNNDFDYTKPYDLLKSANSTKGLLDGVDMFINTNNGNQENKTSTIKTPGYYLAMLFELSGLPVKGNPRNQHIIKSIIKDNEVKDLNAMLSLLISKNGEKNNLASDLIDAESGNLINDFCKDYKDLAQKIYDIDYFKKSKNNSGNGKGELLLQLLIGTKNENDAGDVVFVINQTQTLEENDKKTSDNKKQTLEVKGKNGKLGNSEMNSTKTTEEFIKKLKGIGITITSSDSSYDRGSCFGGTQSDKDGGIKKFNEFWQKITLNYKNNNIEKEDLETEIFKCYIETIFNKYGYNEFDENLLTILENENPFKIDNNTLKINKVKTDFIPLTGFLYLYAYQKTSKFNHLIVFDEKLNFSYLNCENILNKAEYQKIKKQFSFTLPGNTNDKSGRSNVASINLKKITNQS